MRSLPLAALLVVMTSSACSNCEGPVPGIGSGSSSGTASTDVGDGGNAASAGGSSGLASSGSGAQSSSTPACPTYQSFCGGACIPTVNDPDNCGACNRSCAQNEVCLSGTCTTMECLPGTTRCNRECVDTATDNRHCGGCDNACAMGEGCSDGDCVDAIDVGPAPAACEGGGPAIIIDLPTTDACAGQIAQTTFRWALCACEDIQASQSITTDAFDSTQGPYVPGGLGAGVGANGRLSTSSALEIGGSLWLSGDDGVGTSGSIDVAYELRSGGRVTTSSTCEVGRDGFVEDDVVGDITFGGTLHIPEGANVGASVSYAQLVREPVDVEDPCDCRPASILPIAAIITARATNNDNALIGLDEDALANPTTAQRLDLPCGHFYLSRITASAPITIVAHGRVALYIGENIGVSENLRITVDATGSLDIFVGGTIGSSGQLALGAITHPALTRVYVATTGGIGLSQNLTLGANLYAPRAQLGVSADIDAYGGLFVGNFSSSADTRLHYDRAILQQGASCPGVFIPPVTTDGGVPVTSPDAGTFECASCQDCGNQACNAGVCGGCSVDADCCAPLFCIEGVCGFPGG